MKGKNSDMIIEIKITTDNEAFEYPCELRRILQYAANLSVYIEEGDENSLYDVNGNIVGYIKATN